ncbi:T9SS type A sorting domain-containing protein [Paraflavitalea sp. CAU 1676]|uniref:T9SS type A sorting domain-containing protein n=1 Tax=Paraflavitalea sp. CAU 1676 TaxID=3032598 RepID=UPI0023DB64EA|nr:T9SS type A sorting domain-containing protein [Paraflavitalea sp. CAU 1676]MDF2192717.1 T9SS type A sorting domain-containing protein [Paraflavitalea sp. CAU 1676]
MMRVVTKCNTVVLLMLVCTAASAQQLSIQTTNSAGRSHSAGSILLEDAVGGLVAEAVNSNAIMYTPDFLQPVAGTTTNIPTVGNVQLGSGFAGLDNGGGTFSQNALLLEFTVGEVTSISLQQQNSLLTQGILQPFALTALPVMGLDFFASRINSKEVRLTWKTVQEIDNKGFFVERKIDSDTGFAVVAFERTKAPNGTSIFPNEYVLSDANNFTGRTYYRLKQQDIDGRFSYSVIRWVTGEANKSIHLKAWPVPAINYFNISLSGIEEDVVQVFDGSGRLVRSFMITAAKPQQVNDLKPGVYILKVLSDRNISQRVIVQ